MKLAELFEVSKTTLASYIPKAAQDAAEKSSRAAYKLAGGDDEATKNGDDGEKDDKKAFRRLKGVKLATKKLAK